MLIFSESGWMIEQETFAGELLQKIIECIETKDYSLISELRKVPLYSKKPILVLTTERSDEMKAKGKAAGATGWIVKPFVPDQLLKAVNIVLSR
jgi:DNA-binding response OmpR family regulator